MAFEKLFEQCFAPSAILRSEKKRREFWWEDANKIPWVPPSSSSPPPSLKKDDWKMRWKERAWMMLPLEEEGDCVGGGRRIGGR